MRERDPFSSALAFDNHKQKSIIHKNRVCERKQCCAMHSWWSCLNMCLVFKFSSLQWGFMHKLHLPPALLFFFAATNTPAIFTVAAPFLLLHVATSVPTTMVWMGGVPIRLRFIPTPRRFYSPPCFDIYIHTGPWYVYVSFIGLRKNSAQHVLSLSYL